MRTLRRADLVHLDCVADNIFVDLESRKTTLIDLDGCGIVRRTASASSRRSDEWEHRPLTLGHLKVFRPPPWYPQLDIESGPKAGNYLFAERWVVIDTLICILTWNRVSGVLSWLESGKRKSIADAYLNIKNVIKAAKETGYIHSADNWTALYSRILSELRSQLDPLPPFAGDGKQPHCLDYFANLSQAACFDPTVLGSQSGSPYETYRKAIG